MPHPVAQVPDVKECVRFILASELRLLRAPWPRCQDLPARCFDLPEREDLVVCISHAWPYSAHPDPTGEKIDPILWLLDVARSLHNPQGRVLVFCDWLSVPQRPYAARQADRTAEEEDRFVRALRAFPQIYLQADVVLHIDLPASQVQRDGEAYHIPISNLQRLRLSEFRSEVFVAGWKSESDARATDQVGYLDVVESVDGQKLGSLESLAQALRARARPSFFEWYNHLACCGPERGMAKMVKRPFGRRNVLKADERGWVFLERFISMVKAAMVTEGSAASVALATSEELRAFLLDGSLRLREAVKSGRGGLEATLRHFVEVLEKKQFARVCVDQVTNQAAFVKSIPAISEDQMTPQATIVKPVSPWSEDQVTHQAAFVEEPVPALSEDQVTHQAAVSALSEGAATPSEGDEQGAERRIIADQMHMLAAHLLANWEQEEAAQRLRQLIMAIGRADMKACRELLSAGADPNSADSWGLTAVHSAAKLRNVAAIRLLVEARGDLTRPDKMGNLPAHSMALFAEDATVELFKVLAPTIEILRHPNSANVKAFNRFHAYALTAKDGKPFQPALDWCRVLQEKHSELEEVTMRRLSAAATFAARRADALAIANVGLLETVEERVLDGWPVRAHVWQASSRQRQIDVLYVGTPIFLPWSIQLEGLRLLAGSICKTHGVRLVAVGHESFFGRLLAAGPPSVRGVCGVVAKVIEALPLKPKFFLLDSTTGFLTPLLWNLQDRLLGAVVVNPTGWFQEGYIGTPAYEQFFKRVEMQCKAFQAHDIRALMKSASNFGFTACSGDAAEMADCYGAALERECDTFFDYYSPGVIYEHLRSRTDYWKEHATWPACRVPVVVACGSHSPVLQVQETAMRVKDILPKSVTAWISDSKHWWQAEGEKQADCVAQMLTGLIHHRGDLQALELWVAKPAPGVSLGI